MFTFMRMNGRDTSGTITGMQSPAGGFILPLTGGESPIVTNTPRPNMASIHSAIAITGVMFAVFPNRGSRTGRAAELVTCGPELTKTDVWMTIQGSNAAIRNSNASNANYGIENKRCLNRLTVTGRHSQASIATGRNRNEPDRSVKGPPEQTASLRSSRVSSRSGSCGNDPIISNVRESLSGANNLSGAAKRSSISRIMAEAYANPANAAGLAANRGGRPSAAVASGAEAMDPAAMAVVTSATECETRPSLPRQSRGRR